jgi:hypothetical protein
MKGNLFDKLKIWNAATKMKWRRRKKEGVGRNNTKNGSAN